MRRLLPILICLGLAAMATVALARIEIAPRAGAAAIAATGSFEISNSHEGRPIFSATGIAPGETSRGTVVIEDTGTQPVALQLRLGELIDASGLGGGVLSSRLQLTVADVTEPAATQTVYTGPLASMPDQAVGRLEGGETRIFEFIATLPEGGAPSLQNAVQGAATTVAYSWVAEEVSEEEQPAVPETSAGAPSGGQHDRESAPGNGPLDLTMPKIRWTLRGGHMLVWINCDRPCRLYVRGRIRATGIETRRRAKLRFADKRLHAPGPRLLRIPIPRGLRHWMRQMPGHERLQARLRVVAVDPAGRRDTVLKTMRLRAGGR